MREPKFFPAGRALETYLRKVCLRQHLERLSDAERAPLMREVLRQLDEPVIDAVRLNMLAQRA